MEFKMTLEAARIMMGYSLKDAAELFGVHYQTLSKWEENPSLMKQKYVSMIPNIYCVPVSNIFFGPKNEFILLNKKNELNYVK